MKRYLKTLGISAAIALITAGSFSEATARPRGFSYVQQRNNNTNFLNQNHTNIQAPINVAPAATLQTNSVNPSVSIASPGSIRAGDPTSIVGNIVPVAPPVGDPTGIVANISPGKGDSLGGGLITGGPGNIVGGIGGPGGPGNIVGGIGGPGGPGNIVGGIGGPGGPGNIIGGIGGPGNIVGGPGDSGGTGTPGGSCPTLHSSPGVDGFYSFDPSEYNCATHEYVHTSGYVCAYSPTQVIIGGVPQYVLGTGLSFGSTTGNPAMPCHVLAQQMQNLCNSIGGAGGCQATVNAYLQACETPPPAGTCP